MPHRQPGIVVNIGHLWFDSLNVTASNSGLCAQLQVHNVSLIILKCAAVCLTPVLSSSHSNISLHRFCYLQCDLSYRFFSVTVTVTVNETFQLQLQLKL